jgi:glycosyltransferase involved in cell wall biosynthesis
MSIQSPKTVLFLDHTAKMGGGEYALLHLVQRLDRTRYIPVVVLISDGPLREKLQASGVETRVLRLSPRIVSTRKDTLGLRSILQFRSVMQTIGYCWKLSRFMKQRGIDIVHTNSLKADIIGGASAYMAHLPVVWHIRDRIEDDYLPGPVVKVFRWLCRIVPYHVITNSHATLETLKLPPPKAATTIYSGVDCNGAGPQETQFSVVHDGVVEDDFAPGTANKTTPLIGIVGRVARWKGQHIFLQAAAKVRQEIPGARFQIIGSSLFGEESYGEELQSLVKELQLEDCVEFTGFISNVSDYMQKLDVLVHASITSEPFGLVVVEGMVAGKPIVATRGGGVLEIVRDGETGLLVGMGDVDEMANAIAYLLKNPEEARKMGQAGRKRVKECFTIDLTVQKVQEVYEDVLLRWNSPKNTALPSAVDSTKCD